MMYFLDIPYVALLVSWFVSIFVCFIWFGSSLGTHWKRWSGTKDWENLDSQQKYLKALQLVFFILLYQLFLFFLFAQMAQSDFFRSFWISLFISVLIFLSQGLMQFYVALPKKKFYALLFNDLFIFLISFIGSLLYTFYP